MTQKELKKIEERIAANKVASDNALTARANNFSARILARKFYLYVCQSISDGLAKLKAQEKAEKEISDRITNNPNF